MLTQIEIDGFKTFKDFKVELAPFQVIVGPNGSGKSNLFDAMQLLSRLADTDLRTAFQGMRGDADELFTLLPNGKRVDSIRIAVEMFVDRKVKDRWGKEVELQYRRLRYEIEILSPAGRDQLTSDKLLITREQLTAISPSKDKWGKRYNIPLQKDWKYFISTHQPGTEALSAVWGDQPFEMNKDTIIKLEWDIKEKGIGKTLLAEKTQGTVLSSVSDTDYPHVFAARQELLSLKLLHPDPEELRQPSSVKAPAFLSVDGSNLPAMLARMKDEDEFALNDVSRDLANLVPGVVSVELKNDDFLNRYIVSVKYQDGRSFPSSVLSDGTLRLLALAALKNDQQFRGILCFEEPENGIHPSYLKDIAHLLRSMATDLSDPEQVDEPLRQVLVTTHSPTFISQPDAIDVVLFTYTVTRVEPQTTGIPPMRITQIAPVFTSGGHSPQIDTEKGKDGYTLDRVKELLINESLDDALELLDKSRTMLNERSQ